MATKGNDNRLGGPGPSPGTGGPGPRPGTGGGGIVSNDGPWNNWGHGWGNGPQSPNKGSYEDPTQRFGPSFGDIVHWRGNGQTVGPSQDQSPQDQGPQPPTMSEWQYQAQFGGGGGGFSPGSINYDDYQATTREVQDEELASWQLQQMLESDSAYMEQARRAGERAAANRGALSSSIFAGSSQASAIQAAAPIAQSDATAFRAAASQNMQAQNQMSLAKLQSETGVLQSTIAASASVASSSIAASANKEIAAMRIQSERDMAEFSSAHDAFMQNLQQEGRVELFELDSSFRERLAERGFDHDLTMQEMANEYALDQIGYRGTVESYLQNQQLQGGFLGSLANNIFGSINTISQLGLDDQGFQTAINNIWGTSGSLMNLFNSWIQEGQFPEIEIPGSQQPGGG